MKSIHIIIGLCILSLLPARRHGSLYAQNLKVPSLSPAAELKQEVGLTEIQLSYARPSAKGRKVMGELVPFGEIWRTGANASTKLTFSEDVTINGNELPTGTYALYTIPNKNEWTIIIHKKTDMRSIAGGKVKPENDAFRFQVKPIYNPLKVETFTIQFTDVTTNTCHLQLAWEHTVIKIPIEIEVDKKVADQMEAFLETPEKTSHRVYFRGAEYYLNNGKDLAKAMEWINMALDKSENNFRYGLLKSKIYIAQGNRAQAISTVKTANDWAKAAKSSNYIQQTQVYLESIENQATAVGTSAEDKYSEDVKNLDNILAALYGVISGDKGVKRDWGRFKHLHIPEARLIPTGKNKEGITKYRIFTPDDYINLAGAGLEENGFHEVEVHREVETYGSLVHVFSTYESFRSKTDKEPFMRGINSIQLMNDGNRWWIVQIYWLGETQDNRLPTKYLPSN